MEMGKGSSIFRRHKMSSNMYKRGPANKLVRYVLMFKKLIYIYIRTFVNYFLYI